MGATRIGKQFVLCADDFGLTLGASAAIVALAEINAISAASCVVDGEFSASYARDLSRASSQISLGLHFNLTAGAKQAAIAPLSVWLVRAFVFQRLARMEIVRDIQRQLDTFETLF